MFRKPEDGRYFGLDVHEVSLIAASATGP